MLDVLEPIKGWYEAPASFSNNSRNITHYSDLPSTLFSQAFVLLEFVFSFNFGYYWLGLLIAICF